MQTHFSFYGNNNRIDQYSSSYDVDGNLLTDGLHAYTYDAENRIVSTGSESYIYDAEGARVAKVSGGTLSSVYLLNAANQQITELNGSGVWMHSNVYTPGGRLLATYEGPGESSAGYHYNLPGVWRGVTFGFLTPRLCQSLAKRKKAHQINWWAFDVMPAIT